MKPHSSYPPFVWQTRPPGEALPVRDPGDLHPAIEKPAGSWSHKPQRGSVGSRGAHPRLGCCHAPNHPLLCFHTSDCGSRSEASRLEGSAETQGLLSQLLDELFLATQGFSFFYISGALSKDYFPPQSHEIFLSSLKCLLCATVEED